MPVATKEEIEAVTKVLDPLTEPGETTLAELAEDMIVALKNLQLKIAEDRARHIRLFNFGTPEDKLARYAGWLALGMMDNVAYPDRGPEQYTEMLMKLSRMTVDQAREQLLDWWPDRKWEKD